MLPKSIVMSVPPFIVQAGIVMTAEMVIFAVLASTGFETGSSMAAANTPNKSCVVRGL